MGDKIFPELFAWQMDDGTIRAEVWLTPEERRLVAFQEAINKIEEQGMGKYYVIRYRNAPESKGMDVYLSSLEDGTATTGAADKAMRFRSRLEAENYLEENPRFMLITGPHPGVGSRKHHLMADIAEVERVNRVTVRGI